MTKLKFLKYMNKLKEYIIPVIMVFTPIVTLLIWGTDELRTLIIGIGFVFIFYIGLVWLVAKIQS
jgi:hypothetical protein